MSTLATLKAEIADDLKRSDLTAAIAASISKAIRFYQPKHFYFNESRDRTFSTVAGKIWYSGTDDADIPLWVDRDFLHITISNNRYRLTHYPIARFEVLTDANATNGQPYAYTYYNRQIGIFPPADKVYEVRMVGSFSIAEPASDSEADNVWMVETYDLIRSRVVSDICRRKIRNYDRANSEKAMEMDELGRLYEETAKRAKTDRITPVAF